MLQDRYWALLTSYCQRKGQLNDLEAEMLRKETGLKLPANDIWESLNIRSLSAKIAYVEAALEP